MRVAAVVLLLVAAPVLYGLAAPSDTPVGPVPDYRAEGYVGPSACRSCHVELYDRWAASAHARSTEVATASNLPPAMVEGAVVDHAPGRSVFRREGDRIFVTTLGPDGEELEYPVTHIVGPKRISFFVTRLEDGRMQVLPGMRDIPEDRWFDYTHLIFGVPGQVLGPPPTIEPGEPTFWTGPVRSYDRTCGRCHTSGRRVPSSDPARTHEWHPLEIDCEACHGPGKAHVDFWKNPPETFAEDPILVLSQLGRDRAQAVCLWCHMEAEVVDQHWRPGDDVFEFLSPTLLDNLERIDAAGRCRELIYDGLPFLFSECAEEGGLTCLTCHDAHGTRHTADLLVPPDKTFTLCEGCHADIAADAAGHSHHDMTKSGGRCVGCHMPYLAIERGHGIVRDHTIGSPLPRLPGENVTVDACTWCHTAERGAPADAPVLPADEILTAYDRWYPGARLRPGWVAPISDARRGSRSEETFYSLVGLAGDADAPKAVRASAARLLLGFPDRSLLYLLDLLGEEDSLVRRSAAYALKSVDHPDADAALLDALGDASKAVRVEAARAALDGWWRVQRNAELLDAVVGVLEEDAAAAPQEDSRWFRLGAAKQLAGDVRGAIEAYEKKLALNPYATAVRETVEALRARREGTGER
jgi:predicted CXXCH cytochrome family protein